MSQLASFMMKLGEDAELMAAYRKDPRGTMKAHGLTDEEIEAVMSGDTDKVKALSGNDSDTFIVVYIQNY